MVPISHVSGISERVLKFLLGEIFWIFTNIIFKTLNILVCNVLNSFDEKQKINLNTELGEGSDSPTTHHKAATGVCNFQTRFDVNTSNFR